MEESPSQEPQAPKPTAEERRAALEKQQRVKRRKGFLIGLLVGQILILVLDFGGVLLLELLKDRVQFNAPYPLQAVVFLGMAFGIVVTGLMIFFVLGLQGAGWMFGKKKTGFFTAVGRGMKRCFKAAWALGLTLGVIGGTGWFLIPHAAREQMVDDGRTKVEEAAEHTKTWVNDFLKPREEEPAPEDAAPKE